MWEKRNSCENTMYSQPKGRNPAEPQHIAAKIPDTPGVTKAMWKEMQWGRLGGTFCTQWSCLLRWLLPGKTSQLLHTCQPVMVWTQLKHQKIISFKSVLQHLCLLLAKDTVSRLLTCWASVSCLHNSQMQALSPRHTQVTECNATNLGPPKLDLYH